MFFCDGSSSSSFWEKNLVFENDEITKGKPEEELRGGGKKKNLVQSRLQKILRRMVRECIKRASRFLDVKGRPRGRRLS